MRVREYPLLKLFSGSGINLFRKVPATMKYSVQHKILLSFSIVTFIGLSSLLFVAYKITEQNVSQIVYKDMIDARKSLDVYLKQYFLINNMEFDKLSLESEADNISKGLTGQIGSDVMIYDSNGNNISSLVSIASTSNDDFSRALKGKTAYTVNYVGNKVIVNLSYPIESNKTLLGIMRYSKDYSELYNANRKFETVITIFAVVIFIFIFITSFVIARQIAKPIRILTRSTERISTGEFKLDIRINSKDEIGELADRFKKMALRIKEQIEIIQKDRDALKEAQAQSKSFFDNVTHELKTPLTTILGYAQVLKENGFSDKDFFDKGTSYIINESQRLNHMVIEILELSKASSKDLSYHFDELDLSELIRETCDEMKMKGKKYNIEIHCEVQNNLVLKGDKGRLKEVLINLMDNSIKYGKVNSIIEVEAYSEEKIVFLKVRDQGDGIPEEHISSVFEPFHRISKRASREKGSAGLGLTIVKSIVESHGGHIHIKSKMNEGTEVIIRFGGEENA